MFEWLMLDRETGQEVDRAGSVIMAEFMATQGSRPVAYCPRTGEIIYYPVRLIY